MGAVLEGGGVAPYGCESTDELELLMPLFSASLQAFFMSAWLAPLFLAS